MGVGRALALAVAALLLTAAAHGAAPPRLTGGMTFGPATLVDPLRPAAAPVLTVAGGDIWVAGRSATLARSTDGGDSFRAVAAPPVAPGSLDVAVAGNAVFVASADGGAVTVARSADGGATWSGGTVDAISAATRPWLAVDGSTVFLSVTTPVGTEVFSSPASELAFVDAGGVTTDSPSSRCGRLVFDPVGRMLYLPCVRDGRLSLTTARVPPGARTGLVFQTRVGGSVVSGPVGGPLPSLAVDAAGTPYLVWVDAGTGSLYAAQPGSSPVLINGAGADVAALPVAVGGAPGTFGVAFLGAETELDPNTLPDARSDPRGAAAVRWYGFAVIVSGLTASSADVLQQRTTAKPVHFGRLCTTCPTDPVLGDTIGASLDGVTGALRIAVPDASDGRHVPQATLARQLAGPTILGRSVSRPPPTNGVVDGAGDGGPAALDVTKLELRQSSPATLQVRMTVAGAAPLLLPEGAPSAVWMTRFQILSRGQGGEPAYRSLYAAAISTGGAPRFVAGELACTNLCRAASARPSGGRIEGNTVVADVNLVSLSATVPLDGDLLYNVSGFTFSGDASGAPVGVLDSLASFDYRLDQRIGPTTGRGRRITLRGTIRGATVGVDVFENRSGRVTFRDARAGVIFRSTRITRVAVRGRTATISGTGLNRARRASFVATVVDRGAGRLDSFALRLSTGYRRSGRLTSGNATIRGTG